MAGKKRKARSKERAKERRSKDEEPAVKKEELEYAKNVEGLLGPDGALYLVDHRRGLVFDAQRQRAGDWDAGTLVTARGERIPLGHATLSSGAAAEAKTSEKKQHKLPREEDASKKKEKEKTPKFPFAVEADDHCETPLRAYEELAPVLTWFATEAKKDQLEIYDPYYCAGGVAKKLATLGFTSVRNRNEDCYQCWNDVKFDVLVTNPPYSSTTSGDHIDALVKFCYAKPTNFALLVPEWVHKREAFVAASARQRPLFLSPKSRYVYEPPPFFRDKTVSDTHKKTSPFHSIWIVWAGDQRRTDQLASACAAALASHFRVARSRSQLRDLRRAKVTPGDEAAEEKKKKKKRKVRDDDDDDDDEKEEGMPSSEEADEKPKKKKRPQRELPGRKTTTPFERKLLLKKKRRGGALLVEEED